MPIVRRTNPPKPPKKKVNIYDVPYHPSPELISDLIKEHDRLASDYFWNGDDVKGKHHQDIANNFRERLKRGDMYEPRH